MPSNDRRTAQLFTVDVEEYFQVRALESVVSRQHWGSHTTRVGHSIDLLLDSLDEYHARGTFFVLGWLADHRPEVVRSIASRGHEIASHGYWHERVSVQNPEIFREDVRKGKSSVEQLTGRPVIGYRAPNFSIIPGIEWAFDVLLEEGYQYDSSIFPIRRSGYGYANACPDPHIIVRKSGRLAEFPLATASILRYRVPAAGGGYLRQLPFGIVRRAFRDAVRRGEHGTFYIHPWEIDPGQPQLRTSFLNRIRHYRGLSKTLQRIEALLAEFRFTSIESCLQEVLALGEQRYLEGAA
ncbi:MAG: XrtA system polysaccharide deacetylase [Gemmatimonadaceae bacterium]